MGEGEYYRDRRVAERGGEREGALDKMWREEGKQETKDKIWRRNRRRWREEEQQSLKSLEKGED